MRLVLDGKSLIVGTFAGAASVAALGATQQAQPQPGRFQIAAAGDSRSNITGYVVDTATGQVWRERADKGFGTPKLPPLAHTSPSAPAAEETRSSTRD